MTTWIRTIEQVEEFIVRLPWSGCWLWVGYTEPNGYGRYGRGRTLAHRLVYWLTTGISPAQLLHTCDQPSCVNPEHLKPGTQSDNIRDMYLKCRGPFQILTPEDVLAIRVSEEKGTALAKKYGVTHQQIYSIRNGKSWGWL